MNLSPEQIQNWTFIAVLLVVSMVSVGMLSRVKQVIAIPEGRRKRLAAIGWCIALIAFAGSLGTLGVSLYFMDAPLSLEMEFWQRFVGIGTVIVLIGVFAWMPFAIVSLLKAKTVVNTALGIGELSSTTSPRVKR